MQLPNAISISVCKLTIAVTLLVGVGCHEPDQVTEGDAAKQLRVPVGAPICVAEPIAWPTIVRTQGSLVPDERTVVGTKVSGRIEETLVELGDEVRAGQPLARIELPDFELAIQQAEAQLAEACAAIGVAPEDDIEQIDATSVPTVEVERALWEEAQDSLNRMRHLRKTDAVSQSELERQEAVTRVAKAKCSAALQAVDEKIALISSRRALLEQAQQDMLYATILAPFDGVIEARYLSAGSFVQPGSSVAAIVRINPLRFRARVPERKATLVQVGQPISIQVEGEAQPVEASLVRISPVLDLASRSLQVEAEFINTGGRYRSGLFAVGEITVDADARVLAVPRSAITEFAGIYKVWTVEGDLLRPTRIQVGRRQTDFIEVTGGLQPGDSLLRFSADALRATGKAEADEPKKTAVEAERPDQEEEEFESKSTLGGTVTDNETMDSTTTDAASDGATTGGEATDSQARSANQEATQDDDSSRLSSPTSESGTSGK